MSSREYVPLLLHNCHHESCCMKRPLGATVISFGFVNKKLFEIPTASTRFNTAYAALSPHGVQKASDETFGMQHGQIHGLLMREILRKLRSATSLSHSAEMTHPPSIAEITRCNIYSTVSILCSISALSHPFRIYETSFVYRKSFI